ncbi:unnamed protein product [Paramecium sonneborni]|uniref:Uncharacterized protein n=1 Tax=Paramecium sonneborni TaxID=65129 RepID=A0A8S1MA90_9CILI|nr:unnamed protein product [Paramecium sonneborni]
MNLCLLKNLNDQIILQVASQIYRNDLKCVSYFPNRNQPQFLDILEIQLIQLHNLSILRLACLFQQCYSKSQLNIVLNKRQENKIILFLNYSSEIDDIFQGRIMFFNAIRNHCLNIIQLKFIIRQSVSSQERRFWINDNNIRLQLFIKITKIRILKINQYDYAINIHALNSNYRAKCIKNAKYLSLLQNLSQRLSISSYQQEIL